MQISSKLLSAALITGLWLPSIPASACPCVPMTPAEAYAQAESVLEARVVEVHELTPAATGLGARRSVRVRVVRAWKGVEAEQLELLTPEDSGACGLVFKVDESYLIYASTVHGALEVASCSRSRAIRDASEDLKTLGMGTTTVDPKLDVPTKSAIKPEPPARMGCASCSVVGARLQRTPSALSFGLAVALGYRLRRIIFRRRSASRS